jgi:hypothetical protein
VLQSEIPFWVENGVLAVDAKVFISSRDELRRWLAGKPRQWSQAIAVRAALRVLPLTFAAPVEDGLRARLVLQSCRAAFVAWTIERYAQAASAAGYANAGAASNAAAANAASATNAAAAANAAASNAAAANAANAAAVYAADGAEAAAAAAIYAVDAADAAAEAAYAAYVANAAYAAAADAHWRALSSDAARLLVHDKAASAVDLIAEPLWLIDVRGNSNYSANFPPWVRSPFDAFADTEWATKGPWGVWTAWYREILPNRPRPPTLGLFNERVALEIASQSESFWRPDPHRVTATVSALAGWKWNEAQWEWPDDERGTVPSSKVSRRNQKRPVKSRVSATPEAKAPEAQTSKPPPPQREPQQLTETFGIHSDEATDRDQLGRWPFAKALVEHLDDVYWQQHTEGSQDASSNNNPADGDGFAMHIHAPWGAGKTSVVKMMKTMLERTDRTSKGGKVAPQWVVVEFNAWRNERRNPPWWPLLQAIKTACISVLRRSDVDDAMRVGGYWLWWKAWTDLLPYAVATLVLAISIVALWYTRNLPGAQQPILENTLKVITAAIAVVAAFIGASRFAVFGSATNAKFYEDLSQDPLKRIVWLFNRIVDTTKRPICVVIDDLDRCRSDYIVSLLQGVQTIFRHPSVAYVVPADRNWIKTSFETQYKDFRQTVGSSTQPLGYLFLEKVFQVSTPLPAISAGTRAMYWESLLKSPAGAAPEPDLSQPSSTQPSEQAVEREREIIRSRTDNLTRAVAEDILNEKDTYDIRAALALEIVDIEGRTAEAKHLLTDFKDCVPEIPRVMKRMLNAYAIRQAMGFVVGSSVPVKALARWTILEQSAPALADFLAANPDWVDDRRKVPQESIFSDQLNSPRFAEIIGTGEGRLTSAYVRMLTHGDEAAAP